MTPEEYHTFVITEAAKLDKALTKAVCDKAEIDSQTFLLKGRILHVLFNNHYRLILEYTEKDLIEQEKELFK